MVQRLQMVSSRLRSVDDRIARFRSDSTRRSRTSFPENALYRESSRFYGKRYHRIRGVMTQAPITIFGNVSLLPKLELVIMLEMFPLFLIVSAGERAP